MKQKNMVNSFKILLKIPVPWVFILVYLIGVGLQFIFPWKLTSQEGFSTIKIIGAILFTIGAFFAAWSLSIFGNSHTTTTPGESSKKLVIWGPYRFSRNPMYVSLSLAYLGEAGLLAQVWPLVVFPLIIAYINWIVIPLEEEVLENDFKDEYTYYCAKVRRWF